MSGLDYAVLFGTLLAIAIYGWWKTRSDHDLSHYLHGDASIRWGTIGLSVMATQASAVTFLSTPGQAYESGMGFLQNYFGLPFALIVVCAVFIPIYHRLKVVTAYEYLGQRFDQKTRLLGAFLFLAATRPRCRHHDLRAGHHPLRVARLESPPNDPAFRSFCRHLYDLRRNNCRQPHAKMADGRHPRRDGASPSA